MPRCHPLSRPRRHHRFRRATRVRVWGVTRSTSHIEPFPPTNAPSKEVLPRRSPVGHRRRHCAIEQPSLGRRVTHPPGPDDRSRLTISRPLDTPILPSRPPRSYATDCLPPHVEPHYTRPNSIPHTSIVTFAELGANSAQGRRTPYAHDDARLAVKGAGWVDTSRHDTVSSFHRRPASILPLRPFVRRVVTYQNVSRALTTGQAWSGEGVDALQNSTGPRRVVCVVVPHSSLAPPYIASSTHLCSSTGIVTHGAHPLLSAPSASPCGHGQSLGLQSRNHAFGPVSSDAHSFAFAGQNITERGRSRFSESRLTTDHPRSWPP